MRSLLHCIVNQSRRIHHLMVDFLSGFNFVSIISSSIPPLACIILREPTLSSSQVIITFFSPNRFVFLRASASMCVPYPFLRLLGRILYPMCPPYSLNFLLSLCLNETAPTNVLLSMSHHVEAGTKPRGKSIFFSWLRMRSRYFLKFFRASSSSKIPG